MNSLPWGLLANKPSIWILLIRSGCRRPVLCTMCLYPTHTQNKSTRCFCSTSRPTEHLSLQYRRAKPIHLRTWSNHKCKHYTVSVSANLLQNTRKHQLQVKTHVVLPNLVPQIHRTPGALPSALFNTVNRSHSCGTISRGVVLGVYSSTGTKFAVNISWRYSDFTYQNTVKCIRRYACFNQGKN